MVIKSVVYRATPHTTLLEGKGGYMREFSDDDVPKNKSGLKQGAEGVGQHYYC